MIVLIDTNVIVDFFGERAPFVEDARAIFQAQLDGVIEAFVTATTVTDVYYLVERAKRDNTIALESVKRIIKTYSIVPTDDQLLGIALNFGGKDFEDDLQIVSALAVNAEIIVTRNKRDFKHSPVRVLTPSEMVSELEELNEREQNNE